MKTPRMLTARPALGRAAPALLVVLALSACAGAQKVGDVPQWPPAPATARIKFVRSFRSDQNLGASALRELGRALLPKAATWIVQPTGLALSPDEKILYVTSNSGGRVFAVSLEEKKIRELVITPTGPFGVAVDAQGMLYVTEHQKDDVAVYDPAGKLVRKFGVGIVERPTGIALDRRRQVVYVTSGVASASKHHRIEVFSLAGQHLRTIGTRGHEPGDFNFPNNLAVSAQGNLLVADMLNFRVQIFDPDGQMLGMFGALGAGAPGLFDKIKSVALDEFGNIYVADSAVAIVQIFNAEYQPLLAFGGRGDGPGLMHVPTAMAISSKNTIYVADFSLEAVHEYQLVNTTASDSYEQPEEKEKKASPSPAPAAGAKPAGEGSPGQKPQGG